MLKGLIHTFFAFISVYTYGQQTNVVLAMDSTGGSFATQLVSVGDTLYINYTRRDLPTDLLYRGFIKVSENGDILSKNEYTVTGGDGLNSQHRTMCLVDEHMYLASASLDMQDEIRSYLYKCTLQGDTVWTRQYAAPTGQLIVYSLIAHPEGGFVLLGIVKEQNFDRSDIFILRTDTSGNELWRKTYGVANRSEELRYLLPLGNDEYIGGGWIRIYPPNYPSDNLYYKGLLVKFKNDNTVHVVEMGRPLNTEWIPGNLLPLDNNQILIPSYISDDLPNSDYRKGIMFRIDTQLNIVSQTDVETQFSSLGFGDVRKLDEGDYIFLGSTGSGTTDQKSILVKASPEGEIIWKRIYQFGNSQINVLSDVAILNDGFALVGQVQFPQKIWFVRTDQYGCLVPDCHLADIADADMGNFKVAVYPNPTSDMLYVFNPFPQEVKASLVDFMGKRVKQHIVISAQGTLIMPMYDQPSGIYFLQVSLPGGKVVTEKVIKQ